MTILLDTIAIMSSNTVACVSPTATFLDINLSYAVLGERPPGNSNDLMQFITAVVAILSYALSMLFIMLVCTVDVRMYGFKAVASSRHYPSDPGATEAVMHLTSEYEDVFRDKGFVEIPEDEWMRITIKPEWQTHIPKRSKAYPPRQGSKEVVKNTVGKLGKDQKVSRTKKQVPFAFPVFVVWRRMSDGQKKGQMVVDIRTKWH